MFGSRSQQAEQQGRATFRHRLHAREWFAGDAGGPRAILVLLDALGDVGCLAHVEEGGGLVVQAQDVDTRDSDSTCPQLVFKSYESIRSLDVIVFVRPSVEVVVMACFMSYQHTKARLVFNALRYFSGIADNEFVSRAT